MKIPIVDENDNIIGVKDREERNFNDIIRVAVIWITDKNGNILLQQRKFSKKVNPGKWGPGVAGTVEEGETYESNAYKELEEEIGVKNVSLTKSKKFFGETNVGRRFAQLFLCEISKDQELVPQEDEVQELKWFSKEEFMNFYKEKPEEFPSLIKDLIDFFGYK
ncbi:MAG: NUDIX domain-containing protein [bacterium]